MLFSNCSLSFSDQGFSFFPDHFGQWEISSKLVSRSRLKYNLLLYKGKIQIKKFRNYSASITM